MTNVTFYRNEHLPFLEAKRCTRSDLAYQKHFHEEYSIGLIDEGETEAWCDGHAYRVETGRAISFPPGMLHACRPASLESWKYKMLFIKPEWLDQLEPAMAERLRIPFLLEGRKNQYCRRLINRVADALAGTDEPLAAESAAVELIYALASRNTLDLEHPSGSGYEQPHIRRIQEYLHAHYHERITLQRLEEAVGVSKFHLIRLFKKGTHMPPHAYQNLLRINHAKAELLKRRPIAEIAAETGYYDQSHFSKAFFKIVGVTPQRYVSIRMP